MVDFSTVKNIKHVFFDLDHTLWDFESNSKATVKELHTKYTIEAFSGCSFADFYSVYAKINAELWDQYRHNKISKELLRTERFKLSLLEIGYQAEDIPQQIGFDYLDICPTKTQLFPGAIEILEYLNTKYPVHMITNGFSESQTKKLEHSRLAPYFKELIISDIVGLKKPDPRIFDLALKQAGAKAEESVYIGDNYKVDILGGKNAGWPVIWFNVKEDFGEDESIIRIKNLNELKNIL